MCFLDARVKPERDSNKNKSGNDKKKNKSEYDREEAGDDRGKKDRI